jgi:spore maturation protein CgeB
VSRSLPRVMLVGRFSPGDLERSYQSAFQEVGCEVLAFSITQAVDRNCRLGALGRRFNMFVPVEPWIHKANREMVIAAEDFAPDVVVVFGQSPVRAGALAQMRARRDIRAVHVWQDAMTFMNPVVIGALPIYDLVASYSRSAVEWIHRLGAIRVEWVPLAADPHMHAPMDGGDGASVADVAFIGQWRPERAEAVEAILREMPEADVKIWGLDWTRRARDNPALRRAWQGPGLYEQDMSRTIRSCKANLNIIDRTNFPAANMRFFELPCAGGFQISSACPEMDAQFRDRESVAYFRSTEELVETVRFALGDEPRRREIAESGHRLVLKEHTYAHRVRQLIDLLDSPATAGHR